MPILTYNIDENVAASLKHVMIKHSQISSNIETYKIEGMNNIDNPISPDSTLTLRKLSMDLNMEDGENFAITMIRSLNG